MKSESAQPELPALKNNEQRKEWLKNYRDWPVWFNVTEADEIYYRYDLPDGYSVVVKEYKKWYNPNNWWVQDVNGGDSVACNKSYYLLKPDYHFLADCKSSETDIVNHLKMLNSGCRCTQKGNKIC